MMVIALAKASKLVVMIDFSELMFYHSISIFCLFFVFSVMIVISGLQLILILNELVPNPLLVYCVMFPIL